MTPPRTTLVLTTSFDTRSARRTTWPLLDDRSACRHSQSALPFMDFLSNIAVYCRRQSVPIFQQYGFRDLLYIARDTFIVSVANRPQNGLFIFFYFCPSFQPFPQIFLLVVAMHLFDTDSISGTCRKLLNALVIPTLSEKKNWRSFIMQQITFIWLDKHKNIVCWI